MYRTKYCQEISSADVGERVNVCGWVQKQRDLGSLIFVDLRDRSGIIQLAFDETTKKEIFDIAFTLRSEFVVQASGIVRSRGEAVNANKATGAVEIAVDELKVLNTSLTPPFEIVENSDTKEELRLKYRYLDLRRPDLKNNIVLRHKIAKLARDYYDENGFLEIETPTLVRSTPEGARDYLVPSRVHPGTFYALPQSPQLYKQLLMVSGFDRYMQIARCYRDEDLRADRQPEFTQIDLEMSFADEDDVMSVNERFIQRVFKEFCDADVELPIRRMSYEEAMDKYGSDKPDLRYGFELINVTDALRGCGFKVFNSAIEDGGSVRCINLKGYADSFSRKEIDKLQDFVKTYRAKGLAWAKYSAELTSSFAKFMTEEELGKLYGAAGFEKGDLLLIVADSNPTVVFDSLGALRCHVAKHLGLDDKKKFCFVWITSFPMFQWDEEEKRYVAMHHPFTAPKDEDLHLLDTDPSKVRAKAYDIVLNGWEMGGGSVRIHRRDVQSKIFDIIGITKEEADEKFGFLLEAFKYGAPPHAGMAFGLDRLVSLVIGLDAIRDCIAFPKVQNACELMTECPAPVPQNALNDLKIKLDLE
ncbi:MAG: aspartate--tRNA ligase [Ruminococcaceae bacterium]|nr:aspartate--tRNA ligase [Oscillospiraceae bacterium]